jgi:glyceraldehyde-3-phosphate dehydrogenase type I
LISSVAINGFGRIGRTVFRVLAQRPDALDRLTLCAINEVATAKGMAHLARYDSTHGRFPGNMALDGSALEVDGRRIELLSTREVSDLPWSELGVDLVLECTGAFTDRATAEGHLTRGAKVVLLSQPAQADVDTTVVWGINQDSIQRDSRVISAGSCTTNAVIPVLATLDAHFGVTAGTMTTIHSAMNDQPVLDAYHSEDLRKTRAAFNSIIPVDTGLAVGVQRILPQLAGKLTAHALRVPTLNVSAMDLAIYTHKPCDAQTVNRILAEAAQGPLEGVLGFTQEPLASCDFAQQPQSSIVDASQTQVSAQHLVKILIWFDNEWAYANRLIDIALYLQQLHASRGHA